MGLVWYVSNGSKEQQRKYLNHLWGVVNDDGLLEVPPQDVQVFDVVAIDTDTVFSKKSELDPFPLRIQQVH